MTALAYMVSMSVWDKNKLEAAFDEVLGHPDPSDPKERKRQKIVRAAARLFADLGYRRTSIEQIAREAGVAKGTVYLYFKTKADLMVHVIVEEKRQYFKEIAPVFQQEDPVKRLRDWFRLILVMPTKMPITSKLMHGDREISSVLEDWNPEAKDKSMAMGKDFATQMINAAAGSHRWTAEELDDRVQVVMGIGYFSTLLQEPHILGTLTQERFAAIFADMLVDGIASKK